jgi:hypothetical protein
MPLIRNYGLFWRRTDVFWGHPNVAGHLLGVSAANVRADPIDFKDQQGVYVLYDENFKIVYIGQTGAGSRQRLLVRLRQHNSDALADRWSRFSWFGVRKVLRNRTLAAENLQAHPPISTVLNHIEAVLIAATEPPHNRQGGRFGNDVRQYIQYRDDDALGPDLEEMVRDVYQRLRQNNGND